MNPTKSELSGKLTLTAALAALGAAAKKYGPEVLQRIREAIPVIIKTLRKG